YENDHLLIRLHSISSKFLGIQEFTRLECREYIKFILDCSSSPFLLFPALKNQSAFIGFRLPGHETA
ncbi:hypothetical protein, partial [Siminovitchia thermophila]|uniref:hypothetical protein n=1 Tax=Siminovitchia thermophila TaxID=1245522 RepID=UPI001965B34A